MPLVLIDLIPEAHSVHNGQLEVHIALLEVVGLGPQAYALLMVTGFLGLEGRVEECVHQCGLADAGLPWGARSGGDRVSKAGAGAIPGCWLGRVGRGHPQPPHKRGGRASNSILHCPHHQEPSLLGGLKNNVWKQGPEG